MLALFGAKGNLSLLGFFFFGRGLSHMEDNVGQNHGGLQQKQLLKDRPKLEYKLSKCVDDHFSPKMCP